MRIATADVSSAVVAVRSREIVRDQRYGTIPQGSPGGSAIIYADRFAESRDAKEAHRTIRELSRRAKRRLRHEPPK